MKRIKTSRRFDEAKKRDFFKNKSEKRDEY